MPGERPEARERQRRHSTDAYSEPSFSRQENVEVIPTRMTKVAASKPAANPLQFVKVGPCDLYLSAQEQLKKVEEVKKVKKEVRDEAEDWQSNLDNWKCSRRKRQEHIIERVVEVKKLELEEHDRNRRRSKTFSQMMEERGSKGRKLSLPLYQDDESNDLSDLGLVGGASTSNTEDSATEGSLNGDESQKDVSSRNYKQNGNGLNCHQDDDISNAASLSSPEPEEYTYDRAIQNYVNFTETRVKSGSTRSEVSAKTNGFTKKTPFVPPKPRRESSARIEEKLSALEKLERRSVSTSDLSYRDPVRKSVGVPKVDILKRRSLFEKTDGEEQTPKPNRLSGDFLPTKSIRERLSSLEKQVENTATSLKKLSRLSGELSVKDRLSNMEKGSIDNITACTMENKRYSGGELLLTQSVKDRLSNIEKMNVDEAIKPKTSKDHSENLVEDRLKVNLDKCSPYENAEHSLQETLDPLKLYISPSEQAHNCGRPFSPEEEIYENKRQQHFRHRSLDSLDVDSTDGLGNDSFERVQSLEDLDLCHNYPASSLSGDTDREDSGIHTADVSSSVSQADDCDLHLDNHSVDSDMKLHHQPTILEEMVKHTNTSADKTHHDWTDIEARSTSVSEEPSSDCGGAAVMVVVDTSTQSVRVLERPDSLSIASLPVIPEASTEHSTPCEVTYTFIPKSLCFNTVVNNCNQIEQDILHASFKIETSGFDNDSLENNVNSAESLVNTSDEYCNVSVNENSVNTMTQATSETIDFVNSSSAGNNSCDSEAANSVAILTTPSTNTTLVVDGTGDIAEISLQNSTSEMNYDAAMQNNSSDINTSSVAAPLPFVSVQSHGLQSLPGSPESDQLTRPVEVEPTNYISEEFLQHFQTQVSSQQPFDAVDKHSSWNDAVSVVDPMIVSQPTYLLQGGVTITDCPFAKEEDPFLHININQGPQLEPDVMLTLSPTSMLEPPKEKPPPPPVEISDGEDEITSSKSSLRRLDSTKRIKNEIRLKRSSFLGIEGNNDDNYLEPELELVQPPPDMTTFLQEERRLEQQLYRQSICSESDSTQGESRDSGVELERSHQDLSWPQHARSDSEPFGASTTSEEEEIVKKEREIIEMLEQEEQSRYTNNYSQEQHDIGEKLALRLRELEQEKSHLDWEQEKEEEEARRKAEEVTRCEQEKRIMAREQEIRKQEELLLEQQWASLQDVSLVALKDCRRSMPDLQETVQPPSRPPPPPLPAKPKPTAINNRTSSPQQMTRQTLQALSAAPRSRLISTDTWIQTKRINKPKQEGYNYQHWLIQEAEHRRITEQQQRQALSPRRPVAPQMQWAPPQQCNPPEGSNGKPLPDSIIQTLTQRVQNRFNNADANNNPRRRPDVSQEPRLQLPNPETHQEKMLSVSGKKKCSHCGEELGRGAAMIIESLRLFFHIDCFKCCVCCVQLGDGLMGTDVRVRNNKLHCHNCYSSDDGVKFSCV